MRWRAALSSFIFPRVHAAQRLYVPVLVGERLDKDRDRAPAYPGQGKGRALADIPGLVFQGQNKGAYGLCVPDLAEGVRCPPPDAPVLSSRALHEGIDSPLVPQLSQGVYRLFPDVLVPVTQCLDKRPRPPFRPWSRQGPPLPLPSHTYFHPSWLRTRAARTAALLYPPEDMGDPPPHVPVLIIEELDQPSRASSPRAETAASAARLTDSSPSFKADISGVTALSSFILPRAEMAPSLTYLS